MISFHVDPFICCSLLSQVGNVTPLLLVCCASNDMKHVFDMVSPQAICFVLWVLNDVKRRAVYFDTNRM